MSTNRHLPWLWQNVWANTSLQSPGWRVKDHTPEPLVAAASGLLEIFYCFECIESIGSCARSAAEPLPAAGISWLGAALVQVWERTEPFGLKQPTKSWPWLTARAAVCIYKLLTKNQQDEQGWDYPAAALVMPDSCSVKVLGEAAFPCRGRPLILCRSLLWQLCAA